MSAGSFGWFVQHPNVGHKYACSMEKNDDDTKNKIKEKTNCDT